ncbi:MAG: hypothetical protein NZ937_07075 [Armatimonadetes bacterium]|nr:hypothetical protein [Armatimonadota bacterium]
MTQTDGLRYETSFGDKSRRHQVFSATILFAEVGLRWRGFTV